MARQTTCPSCSSDDLLVVPLSPPNGTPLRFHTCRHCEIRWWEDAADGTTVDLTTVLDTIAG